MIQIRQEADRRAERQLDTLLQRYPVLAPLRAEIRNAYQTLQACYENGGKLLIAGNGGSAADAEHIVGELMKGFKHPRHLDAALQARLAAESPELGPELARCLQQALPAIALDGHPALSTAYLNDCAPLLCFAQQVNGYGRAGDALLAISTSGKSRNILYAAVTARAKGMQVIGLTGSAESPLTPLCDVCIRVPLQETYQIQELHLPIYHCLCLMLEEYFFGQEAPDPVAGDRKPGICVGGGYRMDPAALAAAGDPAAE